MADPHGALLLFYGIVGGGFLSTTAIATVARRRQIARWRRAADALGLDLVCETVTRIPRLNGRIDDFDVDVTFSRERDEVHFSVASEELPNELLVSGATFGSARRRITGDEDFDDSVEARGSRARLAALFDVEIRAELVEHLRSQKGELRPGVVFARGFHRGLATEDLVEQVRRQLALARRLRERNGDWLQRLARSATAGVDAEQRLACLEAFFEDLVDAPDVRDVFVEALTDPEPRCRLLAADVLVRVEVLEALVRDDAIDVAVRVSALQQIERHSARTEVVSLIASLLGSDDAVLLERLIDYARQAGFSELRDSILALAENERVDVAVRTPAIEAMGDFGRPSDAGVLADLLESADEELVAAACRALVRLGRPEHLARLREVKKRAARGRWVWRSATAAIDAVEGRGRTEHRGGLALLDEAEGGDLSLADGGGRVAIVDSGDDE